MTNQQRLGFLIKNLREKKGLTQKEFANRLSTSQSAVARMEAGRQNFTTKELEKISVSLEKKIISINESIDFRIEGGQET
jgi:UDP-N-acetylglucosamine 1-carboxyvinyltransferase